MPLSHSSNVMIDGRIFEESSSATARHRSFLSCLVLVVTFTSLARFPQWWYRIAAPAGLNNFPGVVCVCLSGEGFLCVCPPVNVVLSDVLLRKTSSHLTNRTWRQGCFYIPFFLCVCVCFWFLYLCCDATCWVNSEGVSATDVTVPSLALLSYVHIATTVNCIRVILFSSQFGNHTLFFASPFCLLVFFFFYSRSISELLRTLFFPLINIH